MAAIVEKFNHVPRHGISTWGPHTEWVPHLALKTTLWGVSYYSPHFADEETGLRGSSNFLETNSQQMVEQNSSSSSSTFAPELLMRRETKNALELLSERKYSIFDRSEMCAVCSLPWWADTNLRHLLPSLGSICFISPRTAIHSVETLREAEVPYSFSDHKTLFNKIPQTQPLKTM